MSLSSPDAENFGKKGLFAKTLLAEMTISQPHWS